MRGGRLVNVIEGAEENMGKEGRGRGGEKRKGKGEGKL